MRETLEKIAAEKEIELIFVEGHDNAIIGLGRQFNKYAVVYETNTIIENLCSEMSYEDAVEYFDYNIVDCYFGDSTPIFLSLSLEEDEI